MSQYKGRAFRSRNVISSGILNMKEMKVHLKSNITWKELEECVVEDWTEAGLYTLDFERIPLFNTNSFAKNNILEEIARRSFDLQRDKAKLKVLKDAAKLSLDKDKNEKMLGLYTQEQIDFLKENDIDSNGYSPTGTTVVHTGDCIVETLLLSKIKGASSLPSISKLNEKIRANKKLNVADKMMLDGINLLNSLNGDEESIKDQLAELQLDARVRSNVLSSMKFLYLCSPMYCRDRIDLLDKPRTFSIDGVEVQMVIQEKESAI
jgi:hypothetical protein